jgi:hypothetical protein
MRRILVLLAVFGTTFLAGSSASGGATPALTNHLLVPAAAEFFGSTCAHTPYPPLVDTQCDDIFVLYFRESAPSTIHIAPWALFVNHHVVVQHPDGSDTVLLDTSGYVENPEGSFDEMTFATASVRGSLPMSDGSTAEVDLTWDMAEAELQHGGNDSSYNVVKGIDRHFSDRCLTVNSFAHQQWRAGAPGEISGSIVGRNVEYWDRPEYEPFIAGRSVYTFVYAQHGGC